jgi:PepB aminopeptidase
MTELMTIRLTDTPAPAEWGRNSPVSADGTGLTVHLRGGDDVLNRVQRAARRISGLGVEGARLTGPGWDLEKQWAFAQGFTTATGSKQVEWQALSESETRELTSRAEIASWIREVTNATPEELSPLALAQRAATFLESRAPGAVTHQIITGEALAEAGLVGIHGVGRGSDRPPALLKLDYNPESQGDAPVAAALVGKGITFDSGGYSMKATESMLSMKSDMGGAALSAGGLALAIGRGLRQRVQLFLCCAENLVSGHAYKLGDILHYKNGVSVEVVNTDAEGRLVLADGLILAGESGAPFIIDAATLTGAARVAVGNEYNAVLALDDALRGRVLDYAAEENEPHWPLPLNAWHRDQCPSAYAETANSRPVKGGGAGGASNAAGFLSRFVPNEGRGWVHIDLPGAFQNSDGKIWAAGATAMGMRTIARALLEEAGETGP